MSVNFKVSQSQIHSGLFAQGLKEHTTAGPVINAQRYGYRESRVERPTLYLPGRGAGRSAGTCVPPRSYHWQKPTLALLSTNHYCISTSFKGNKSEKWFYRSRLSAQVRFSLSHLVGNASLAVQPGIQVQGLRHHMAVGLCEALRKSAGLGQDLGKPG